jgi:hypothetical protein
VSADQSQYLFFIGEHVKFNCLVMGIGIRVIACIAAFVAESLFEFVDEVPVPC